MVKRYLNANGTDTVSPKITKRLNSIWGTQWFTKPSQTDDYQ